MLKYRNAQARAPGYEFTAENIVVSLQLGYEDHS